MREHVSGHAERSDRTELDLVRWLVVLAAAAAGLLFTTALVQQKLALVADPEGSLLWDISSRTSCSAVLNAWQSSAFGLPNGVLGVAVFAIFASAALGGALDGRPSRTYLLTLWGLALVFACLRHLVHIPERVRDRRLVPVVHGHRHRRADNLRGTHPNRHQRSRLG